MTVLVALASEEDGEALAASLESRGLRVLLAASGEGALRALKDAEDPGPRLAILDQDLPGLNGLRVLGRIRLETSLLGCEVLIAISARDFQVKEAALKGGALGVLVKPLSPVKMGKTVISLLAGKMPKSREILMDVRRAKLDMALDDLRWKIPK